MRSLVFSVLLCTIIVLFCACASSVPYEPVITEPETFQTVISETEILEPEVPEPKSFISYYISEMEERWDYDFLEDEIDFYSQYGYEFRGSKLLYSRLFLYRPVLFENQETTYILYTDNKGTFFVRNAKTFELIYGLGNIHHNPEKNVQILDQDYHQIRIYHPDTGTILGWHYGEIIEEGIIPEKAQYVGRSFTEGDLFLSDTNNVYSVNCGYIRHIATDVAEILDTNYRIYELIGHEEFDPLFLMLDNTKKVYIGSAGNQDVLDDTSHLFRIY